MHRDDQPRKNAESCRGYVTSTYTYRPDGRLSRIVNPDGTHDFTYDSRGLMETQTVSGEGTYTYGYDVMGRPSSLTYPDGHSRTQAYDGLGRITSRCYEYSGPTTRCYTASYDAVGNPVTMSDPDGSDTLEYDALDRLKKVTRVASGVTTVEDYAYNALGALKVNAGVTLDHQRPRLDGNGTADAAVPATLGGQPVTLDAGGRVTSLRGTSFTWTRDGALREADDPVPAAPETYGVDARSRRYSRMVSGTAQEYYVYEGLDRVAIIGPNAGSSPGAVIESYLFDGIDHPLRIARPGVATTNYNYYELDLAGNVRRLRASGGADLGGYRYSAFGQTVEDTTMIAQPLRWKARWFSPAAGGTYDVRARQWLPELGAFLSADEFRYFRRKGTLWSWPKQNPIRYVDRSGRDPTLGQYIVNGINHLLGGGAPPAAPAAPAAGLGPAATGGALAGGFLAGLLGGPAASAGWDIWNSGPGPDEGPDEGGAPEPDPGPQPDPSDGGTCGPPAPPGGICRFQYVEPIVGNCIYFCPNKGVVRVPNGGAMNDNGCAPSIRE